LETEELELVDLRLDYKQLTRLLLTPQHLFKLNMTQVHWIPQNASTKLNLPDLENFVYRNQGKALSNMESLNALFPCEVDWNFNRLNLDIVVWDNDIPSAPSFKRVKSRLFQSQDGTLISNLPYTNNLFNVDYEFDLDLRILHLYNCFIGSAFFSRLRYLEQIVLHNVTLEKKLRRWHTFIRKNHGLKYLQIFPGDLEARIPVWSGMQFLGLGNSFQTYVTESFSRVRGLDDSRIQIDKLYITNCEALRTKVEIRVRLFIVVECWESSEDILSILKGNESSWGKYTNAILMRTEKDAKYMLYQRNNNTFYKIENLIGRVLTQDQFYVLRRGLLQSRYAKIERERFWISNDKLLEYRDYTFYGEISEKTQNCPVVEKLPPADRCFGSNTRRVHIFDAVLDLTQLSTFLGSGRMQNLEMLDLDNICIPKFIPVPMPSLKDYRLVWRRWKRGIGMGQITFPFVYDGDILDIHRLGIKIDIQARDPGTKTLHGVIRVDPVQGKLLYGDFGGAGNETLRLQNQSSFFPLKRLSLFRQRVDCEGLTKLKTLEQLELYQTELINGTLGMCLKAMTRLDKLFVDAIFKQSHLNVSFYDFPFNLRYLYFTSSENLEISESTPRFEKLEVLGLHVRRQFLGFNKLDSLIEVFPKLRLCFLRVKDLDVVRGILRIETLNQLLVIGVKEYGNQSATKASVDLCRIVRTPLLPFPLYFNFFSPFPIYI
jgi:hypothetical protein